MGNIIFVPFYASLMLRIKQIPKIMVLMLHLDTNYGFQELFF